VVSSGSARSACRLVLGSSRHTLLTHSVVELLRKAERLVAEPPADLDVEAAFDWYEKEQPGLGLEFLDELRAVYDQFAAGTKRLE